MLINLKTSEANKAVVSDLTRKFFPTGGPENVVSRIAFAYSLSRGVKLNPNTDLRDSKGKEYKEDILFGGYRDYYVALVCQHYGLHKTDRDIPKYIKLHVDDGLERMNRLFADNRTYTGLDFLIEHLERGVEALDEAGDVLAPVRNVHQPVRKGHFSGPVKLHFGQTADGQPVAATLNNKHRFNNAHIAVAGNSGTGKTQFALDLLRQFTEATQGGVNFLYLDFKGLRDDDVRQMQPFFERTNCTFVNAPEVPFPLNPLSFIDTVNEKNRLMGINKFVDILVSYAPRMGSIQRQLLKDATREAFASQRAGEHPSLSDVADRLFEVTGQRPDTLTELMSNLSEYKLFEARTDPKASFLNRNVYLSLSGGLDRTIRFTATFLVINYVYNTFMNLENAPVDGDLQALRYVLLIDEAHVLFKDRKNQEILENILREIRSKGVAVVLLSQGIEEFAQPTFDFSSLCDTSILLDIKNKDLRQMARFLGLSGRAETALARNMERIQKGQAVSNLKEGVKKGELFEVGQFWKS
ncbi:helicase HerA-like domain-containing protein [Umezakia ovalisporum]|uniref:DUF853 family protein n=1 Tax=Umezakia ovalisporum FSS-43 TaxID=2740520 RepID=A0ABT6K193_9CYAN|nr:helicase HerA-like domain-containing protein [Umezakia ovalisporum]MDH6056129.1 DUF853 family protein [Umezakia ovalisporum FSS-43]